eukprot:gene19901-20409_t
MTMRPTFDDPIAPIDARPGRLSIAVLSDMSFGVSLDDGRLEYAGTGIPGLFAQPANLTSRRFWRMLRDLARFYREAPSDAAHIGSQPLGAYLSEKGYSESFRDDHLYPMAAAIWSTPAADIGAYPAAAFIRFCQNHGLLQFLNRPLWRTVDGGSRAYVDRILADFRGEIASGQPVIRLRRRAEGVDVLTSDGRTRHFDAVVVATHADQALRLLADPSDEERHVLGAFNYISNRAVLHADATLMPKRRLVWAAWNYLSHQGKHGRDLSVTYWMNKLQGIPRNRPMFVTLNPIREPAAHLVYRTDIYEHPQFDPAAMAAQPHLWSLQGLRNTWYCGAHFGAGFHEDGLQSGLAVAEELGGVRRPWTVAAESGRIILDRMPIPEFAAEAAQ